MTIQSKPLDEILLSLLNKNAEETLFENPKDWLQVKVNHPTVKRPITVALN